MKAKNEIYKRALAITDRLLARKTPALYPQICYEPADNKSLQSLIREGTVIEDQAEGMRAGTMQYRMADERDDKGAKDAVQS